MKIQDSEGNKMNKRTIWHASPPIVVNVSLVPVILHGLTVPLSDYIGPIAL